MSGDSLRRLDRKLKKAARRVVQAESEIEEVIQELAEERKKTTQNGSKKKQTNTSGPPVPGRVDPRDGAAQLLIEQDDQGIAVHIDNAPQSLPLRGRRMVLATLLALCQKHSAANPGTNGSLVPIKSNEELMEQIGKLTGHHINVGTLRNHVRRLRRLLLESTRS